MTEYAEGWGVKPETSDLQPHAEKDGRKELVTKRHDILLNLST
jgi:hypothetical protein